MSTTYPDLPTFSVGDWYATGLDSDGLQWVLEDCEGWDDSADVRLDLPVRSGANGSFDAPGFYAPREIILTGVCIGGSRQLSQIGKRTLSRVASDLRAGAELTAHLPDGDYLAFVKRSGSWRVTSLGSNGFRYQAEMVAPDPLIYSASQEQASTALVDLSEGEEEAGDWLFPATFDYGFGGAGNAGAGLIIADNAGAVPTSPTVRIDGPGVNLSLTHVQSGNTVTITSLAFGEFVVLDFAHRSVLLMGTQPRRDLLATTSRWFDLRPGSNTIRFYAREYTPALATMTWRSAWQ